MKKINSHKYIYIISTILILLTTQSCITLYKKNNSKTTVSYYVNNNKVSNIPSDKTKYLFDTEYSNCTNGAKISWNNDTWSPSISNLSKKTSCNLYFYEPSKPDKGSGAAKIVELSKTDTTNLVADDETLDHNTRYIGANPNNYVKFNDELWRIIGVFNNIDDGTGKKDTRMKIIRKDSLGKYSWDTSDERINGGHGINEWSQADLQKELNTDYLGNITIGTDGKWYSNSNNSKDSIKSSTILSQQAQSKIGNAIWRIGASRDFYNDGAPIATPNDFYKYETSKNTGKQCRNGNFCNDTVTRTTSWIGKTALMYPSDFGFATSGSEGMSREECLKEGINKWSKSDTSDCLENNWMFNAGIDKWTLTPEYDMSFSYRVYFISGYGQAGHHSAYISIDVYPVVYLNTNVKITSGSGTENDAFELN